jgi:hypothetical protein
MSATVSFGALSTVVCADFIAIAYARPRSMKGGDLHWIWKPYELYQEVDYVEPESHLYLEKKHLTLRQIYGVPALERGDGFPNAQCKLYTAEHSLHAALSHCSLCSIPKHRRDAPQSFVCLLGPRRWVARSQRCWVRKRRHDGLQDNVVLAPRILLRRLLHRTQLSQRSHSLVDHT